MTVSPNPSPDHALDEAQVRAIVERGVQRYFASRRAAVEPFVDQHFSLRGAWAINRKGLGRDILRAPLNTLLVAPALAKDAAAYAARRAGFAEAAHRLDRTTFFLPTDVAREIDWLVFSELLDLPYQDRDGAAQIRRAHDHDALSREILSDPVLTARLEPALLVAARAYADPGQRQWLDAALRDYADARSATAELATLTLVLMTGALLAKDLTPGIISLGPAMAEVIAQHVAASGTGVGAGLGLAMLSGGAHPSTALILGSTGGVIAAAAAVTAMAGVVTDPLQRALGLHQSRLHRFLDTLEERLLEDTDRRYKVVDAYVGRIMDVADLLYGLWRHAS